MHPTRQKLLTIIALGVWLSLPLRSLTAMAIAAQPSRATAPQPYTPSTTLQGREQSGPPVILQVRALVPDKVTLSDPAQGTVRATVLTIDKDLNQITVQTDAGQRLMLFLTPAALARLHVGAPCVLQVAQGRRGTSHAHRRPRRPSGKTACPPLPAVPGLP